MRAFVTEQMHGVVTISLSALHGAADVNKPGPHAQAQLEFTMKKLSVPLATVAMFGLLAATGARAEVPDRLLGDSVPVSAAQRTIVITPDTRWVNVTEGEIVDFKSNGQDFAYNFDSLAHPDFDLSRIAPAGAVDHRVMVYVARNPTIE